MKFAEINWIESPGASKKPLWWRERGPDRCGLPDVHDSGFRNFAHRAEKGALIDVRPF
jgi:hypothetical protein